MKDVRCETYCSRTRRSGRGSRALRHTDNSPGCRCDRSGIQTAQERTCHQGPWWLQTFSTVKNHSQAEAPLRGGGAQSLIEDVFSFPPEPRGPLPHPLQSNVASAIDPSYAHHKSMQVCYELIVHRCDDIRRHCKGCLDNCSGFLLASSGPLFGH